MRLLPTKSSGLTGAGGARRVAGGWGSASRPKERSSVPWEQTRGRDFKCRLGITGEAFLEEVTRS